MGQPERDEPTPDRHQPARILAEAARAVHAERDLGRVARWTARAACAVARADVAALCLLTGDGSPTWTGAGTAAPRVTALADPRAYPPLLPVLRGHIAGVQLDGIVASPGDGASLGRVLGVDQLLAVGIPARSGGSHGVLLVGHRSPSTDDATERALQETPNVEAAGADEATPRTPTAARDGESRATLMALAAHFGVAVDNHVTLAVLANLEASQREVVHQLQEAVRPLAPVVPYTELGVRYLAADPSAPTGGDLYDWLVLPNGDLHLAVVDIMGKGVAATKDALAVTHALRSLVLEGCPLAELVARADALVRVQNPELVATLVAARYRPATGYLALVGAGHPPPLLLSRGMVEELTAPGIPIGWPGVGSEGVTELHLERWDTVIFYTDGLIEARGDAAQGLEALHRHAQQTAEYPATHLARVLVERALEGAVRRDDSLALVLRRRSPSARPSRHVLGPFEYRFSPNLATVPLARHFLRDWLERVPVDDPAAEDLVLVASELCANAVRHASGRPRGVALRARADGPDVVIEVENDDGGGSPFAWPVRVEEVPDPSSEQGRGLFLIEALSDDVGVEVRDGHTVVRCVKRAAVAGS